jgi:hypothetical protein
VLAHAHARATLQPASGSPMLGAAAANQMRAPLCEPMRAFQSVGTRARSVRPEARTAIDKVAHEDVVGVWHLPAHVEQLDKVVELAVNIADDGDRQRDRLHVVLLDHDRASLLAQPLDITLGDDVVVLDARPGFELVDDRVEVCHRCAASLNAPAVPFASPEGPLRGDPRRVKENSSVRLDA